MKTEKLAMTGVVCAYPIAILFMGQSADSIAFYAYIIPFLISTVVCTIVSALIIYSLKKSNVLYAMQKSLNR